jgi:hypothetical protein
MNSYLLCLALLFATLTPSLALSEPEELGGRLRGVVGSSEAELQHRQLWGSGFDFSNLLCKFDGFAEHS